MAVLRRLREKKRLQWLIDLNNFGRRMLPSSDMPLSTRFIAVT